MVDSNNKSFSRSLFSIQIAIKNVFRQFFLQDYFHLFLMMSPKHFFLDNTMTYNSMIKQQLDLLFFMLRLK